MQSHDKFTCLDSEVQIGDALYHHCDVTVNVIRETTRGGLVSRAIDGTIRFSNPISVEEFFDEKGHPIYHDVIARNDEKRVNLEGFMLTGDGKENSKFEYLFVVSDFDVTKTGESSGPEEVGEDCSVALVLDGETVELTDIDYETDIQADGIGNLVATLDVERMELRGEFTATVDFSES